MDVVFVRQADGSYKSTPFYVKFGKIGVLQSKEKTIFMEVNGKEVEKTMILNDSGVASFPQKVPEEECANINLCRSARSFCS